MPSRARRRRSANPGDVRRHVFGGALAVLSLAGLAAGAYFYFTLPRPPALDRVSLCPVSGPRAITAILLDSTDDIPDIGKREIKTILTDIAETLPDYALLDLRLLDPAVAGGRPVFGKCNPGDGSGLSEYTANPRLARQRWMDEFRQPLGQALAAGLKPTPSKTSPIMETIQRIAVERFAGRAAEGIPKSLVLVSDMLEHEPDYSQYAGDLSFARYKASRAYKKLQTDLHGAAVTIYYIQRATARPVNSASHIQFWADWIRDNNGQFKQASKLQGEG